MMADLSELLKQYGKACAQIALRCAVAVFDRSSEPDPLIEKVKQDKARIASHITSLFASATEAGARIERDKLIGLLSDLIDGGECWLDHNGHCQEHGWFDNEIKCPHARGKEILAAIRERSEGGTQ
jgi:hypothetical protein